MHLKDIDGNFSPTALIPFCEFGGDMAAMGVKLENLEVPVCNSFTAKIFNDQLCYTVDPNDYKHDIDLEGHLSFSLLIDYIEDRQMASEEVEDDNFIIVETIGNLAILLKYVYYLRENLEQLESLLANFLSYDY